MAQLRTDRRAFADLCARVPDLIAVDRGLKALGDAHADVERQVGHAGVDVVVGIADGIEHRVGVAALAGVKRHAGVLEIF